MSIKLYDAVPSSNSDRVKIALHEKSLPYERETLVLARKDQKRPEFLKLNPYGKVPVVEDGGQILFESCIINEYLEEKYPNPLIDAERSVFARPRPGAGRLRAQLHARTLLGAARRDAQAGERTRCSYHRRKAPELERLDAISRSGLGR